MNQDGMWKPALIGGVLLGILSAVPVLNVFNCFCCAWVIGGGIFAAHLYVKSSPTVVTLGDGVGLGLLTGALGGITATLFSIPLQFLMGGLGTGLVDQMRRIVQDLPNVPPETRSMLDSILSNTGPPGIVIMVLGGVLNVIIFGLVGMLGGVIGVALFEKRKGGSPPPGEPPPVNLPPPPVSDIPRE